METNHVPKYTPETGGVKIEHAPVDTSGADSGKVEHAPEGADVDGVKVEHDPEGTGAKTEPKNTIELEFLGLKNFLFYREKNTTKWHPIKPENIKPEGYCVSQDRHTIFILPKTVDSFIKLPNTLTKYYDGETKRIQGNPERNETMKLTNVLYTKDRKELEASLSFYGYIDHVPGVVTGKETNTPEDHLGRFPAF